MWGINFKKEFYHWLSIGHSVGLVVIIVYYAVCTKISEIFE